jgi:putative endonuclease
MTKYYAYILLCKNGMLYVGSTKNLDERMKAHKEGRGSVFVRTMGFKKLLYYSVHETNIEARRMELKLKATPKSEKLKMIEEFQRKKKK